MDNLTNPPVSQEEISLSSDAPDPRRSTDAAVVELIHGCESAVRDHHFKEIYPQEIRERTRQILRLAQHLDEQARTGNVATLDALSCLYLPAFEKAAREHERLQRKMRDFGRRRDGGRR
jgi:hypothetical protein